MTNPRVMPDQNQPAKGNLNSLVQALNKLVDDQRSFLHLSLPERTVAEIQKSFTIGTLVGSGAGAEEGSGIANDASN